MESHPAPNSRRGQHLQATHTNIIPVEIVSRSQRVSGAFATRFRHSSEDEDARRSGHANVDRLRKEE